MIRYTLLRISFFFIALIVLWLCQLRGWPLLILAALVSSVVSLVALRGPREQFAQQVEHKVEERRVKAEAHRTAEDDD